MTYKKHSGFSLLELVIYVGIMSVVVVTITLFSLRVISVEDDNESKLDVNENARFVLQTFTKAVRDAEALVQVLDGSDVLVPISGAGSHPGTLELTTDEGTTLRLNTSTKMVGTRTIRFIQIDEDISDGIAAVALTDDTVSVTQFELNRLTRDDEAEHLQLEFTLESLDQTETASFRTAISIRTLP